MRSSHAVTLALFGAAALAACGDNGAEVSAADMAPAPAEPAAETEPAAVAEAEPSGLEAGSRPNILLIVGDDLGYLDLGLYGSEIRTPNIDALGNAGVILTNFYSSVACQPTRAMLMSGTGNHMAGVGSQGRVIEDNPYYLNHLSQRVISIADRMAEAGYHTYMSGKWHLGYDDGLTPADRGFERSFVLLDPGASHFGDMKHYGNPDLTASYELDGEPLTSLPDDFYSSVAYADYMIEFTEEAAQDDAPFFGYLTFTAPHWPIQALPEDMEKTRGMYDEGWDVIRERRLAAYRDLGFMPQDAPAPGFVQSYAPWDTLTDEDKAKKARTMEAFAAMVERMDAEIGRLVDHLEELGELDNTLIVFMSDNGAEYLDATFLRDMVESSDNSLDNIGHPNSYTFIGPGWGEAGSAPYYLSKGFLAEGGTHVPAFVSAPGLGLEAGRSEAVIAAFDMAPTFLELAGADPAAHADEPDTVPITGRSFAGVLRGEADAARSDITQVNFEYGGQRVARLGDWKAMRLAEPNGTGQWQLFNLADDPGETTDLAAEHADMVAAMTADWQAFAETSGVDLSSDGGAAFSAEEEEEILEAEEEDRLQEPVNAADAQARELDEVE